MRTPTPWPDSRGPSGAPRCAAATLAFDGRILYVGNVGQPANGVPATVSGFKLDHRGRLHPIPGSTRTRADPSRSLPTHLLFTSEGDRMRSIHLVTPGLPGILVQPTAD